MNFLREGEIDVLVSNKIVGDKLAGEEQVFDKLNTV